MLSKLLTLLRLPLIYKNWPLRLLGEVGFDRSRFTYVLRDNVGAVREPPLLKGASEAPIIYDIWHKRVYNPKDFEIKDGDVVVDIGAHKGIFSIFAALQGDNVKVFSYEPVPINFTLLQENIKLNRLADRIKAFNLAVASEAGSSTMFIRDGVKDSVSHSFHYRTKQDFPLEVRCVTLENIFEQNGIDKCNFLKLDCEGAEYQILFNTSKELFNRIERIAMEYHPIKSLVGADPSVRPKVEALEEFLEEVGFEVEVRPPYLYANHLLQSEFHPL
jgi:FkbM family methyltransferase